MNRGEISLEKRQECAEYNTKPGSERQILRFSSYTDPSF